MLCSRGSTTNFRSEFAEHTVPAKDSRRQRHSRFGPRNSRMHNIQVKYRMVVIMIGRGHKTDEQSLQEHATRGGKAFAHSMDEWQLYFSQDIGGGIVCVAFCLFWWGGDNQSIVCIGRSEVRWRSGIFGSISMESPWQRGKGGGWTEGVGVGVGVFFLHSRLPVMSLFVLVFSAILYQPPPRIEREGISTLPRGTCLVCLLAAFLARRGGACLAAWVGVGRT